MKMPMSPSFKLRLGPEHVQLHVTLPVPLLRTENIHKHHKLLTSCNYVASLYGLEQWLQ